MEMKKYLWILLVLWANSMLAQSYGDYYQNAEGLKGDALKTELYNIINGHTEYTYTSSSTDVWDILKETDKDPNNPNNVIFIYSGQSILAGIGGDEYRSGSGWSREHVWAKSFGDFGTNPPAGTDAHHLRAEDISVNSTRNNRSFDNCKNCKEVWDNGVFTGSKYDANEWTFEPRNEVKGDVARMIFYMAVRYEGENGEPNLELSENIPSNTDKNPFIGRLSTLLSWNRLDIVDDWERNRNEIIYTRYQHNRNPFIDLPELAEYIWGNAIGAVWSPTAIVENAIIPIKIYPNPNKGNFFVQLNSALRANTHIEVYNVMGKKVFEAIVNQQKTEIDLRAMKNGVYFIRILDGENTVTQKIVIQ